MKKLFRFHRGNLSESLETTIEVSNKEDIKKAVEQELDVNNLKLAISNKPIADTRLPDEWNKTEYMVMVYFNGNKFPIGYSNFCLM